MITSNIELPSTLEAAPAATAPAVRSKPTNLLPRQGIRYGERHDEPSTDEDEEYEAADQEENTTDPKSPTIPNFMKFCRGDGGVWVPHLVRAVTRTGDQALLLAQIMYWFDNGKDRRPRARLRVNGDVWVAKTHQELGEETGLTPRQVKSGLKGLKADGFITVEYHLFKKSRVSYIRPQTMPIQRAMKAALDKRNEVIEDDQADDEGTDSV